MNEDKQKTPASTSPAGVIKKPLYKQVWFIVVAAIVGFILVAWILLATLFGLIGGSGSKSSAGELFYGMMETASQKTKVRYGYERTTEAKGDSDAVRVKSLAEYDAATVTYSTVFASESTLAQAGRCVKNQEYSMPDKKFPKTFAEAEEALGTTAKPSTDRFPLGTCQHDKVRFYGMYTDGVLPVGLSAEQASRMVQELKSEDPITFKDEGTASYEGRKGRKISFALAPSKTNTPYKPDVLFYAFRDGTTGKVGGNGIELSKIGNHFSTMFRESYGIEGFYIIDETTKLPIFSEIKTLGDTPDFVPSTFTSVYEFPDALTMDERTLPPTIGKPQE